MKVVLSAKDGKSYQKELAEEQVAVLMKRKIGDTIPGAEMGFEGYEFLVTGGADKCGFPMRKGVQFHRKKVFLTKGVGFSGKDRNKRKRLGMTRRKTVCGERITSIINQVNLKITKEGAKGLADAPTESATESAPK
jgi:small subunit ribosomal protein S6e